MANNLESILKEKGITKYSLAKQMNKACSNITYYCKVDKLNPMILDALAKRLGVSADEIIS